MKALMKPLVIISLIFSYSFVYSQSAHKQTEEANKLFAEEKYDEANNKYRDALLYSPESPIINFNIGDVQYKKRNYEEAIKSYEKSLSTDDVLLQSRSYYNMGNTLYKMGKLPESILAYKQALKYNPDDEDAKYNLEYVRAKLKDEAQKQPQQDQQQQQQRQEQQKQDQKQQQNNDRQDQQQQEQEEQEQNQQNQEDQNEQEQQQEQQQAVEQKEISKEDAERILEALQNEEKEFLEKQKKKVRGRPFRGKDW